VSELLNPDGTWNVELLNIYFQKIDVECILQIRPSIRNDEDFLAWQPDSRGIFSVKSAHAVGMEEQYRCRDKGTTSDKPDGANPV
jgi:hypothetical protein